MSDPRSPREQEKEQDRIDHIQEERERSERDNQSGGKYDSNDTPPDAGPSDAGENWDGY